MKPLTHTQKAKNAIKWIDALPKHRKTVGRLRRGDKPSEYSYCCLGVGAKVCKTDDDLAIGYNSYGLVFKAGLLDANGGMSKGVQLGNNAVGSLVGMNDGPYGKDTDFTRVRKFMLRHLSRIFEPGVAKILKEHYKTHP